MDHTNNFLEEDIRAGKGASVLSYLGLLILIPFLVPKYRENPYVRFHMNQGGMIFILSVIINLAGNVLSAILKLIGLGFVAGILGVIIDVLQILIFALMVLGIVGVINGRAKELPLIGGIRIIR